jgi:hypothetical protein
VILCDFVAKKYQSVIPESKIRVYPCDLPAGIGRSVAQMPQAFICAANPYVAKKNPA